MSCIFKILIPYALISNENMEFFLTYLSDTHIIQDNLYYEDWGIDSLDIKIDASDYNISIIPNHLNQITLVSTIVNINPSIDNIALNILTQNELNRSLETLWPHLLKVFKIYDVTANLDNGLIYLQAPWLIQKFPVHSPIKSIEYGAKDYMMHASIGDNNSSYIKFKQLQTEIQLYIKEYDNELGDMPNFLFPLSFINNNFLAQNNKDYIKIIDTNYEYLRIDLFNKMNNVNNVNKSNSNISSNTILIYDFVLNYLETTTNYQDNENNVLQKFIIHNYLLSSSYSKAIYYLGNRDNLIILKPKNILQKIFTTKKLQFNFKNINKNTYA